MRALYSFLFYLILPFIFLRLLWRSRRAPLYRQRLGERLGFCPERLTQSIWIHTVSLGETIAAIPLIKILKERYPQSTMLITNMTPTGSERVKAAFGDSVWNFYIPYDLPDCVARFLKHINPQVCIIMETELWPNLFAACKAHDIPLVVTNARLSEKSAHCYQRVKPIVTEMFTAITILAAQSQADADRFIELGMPREKIRVTGSLKFDLDIPEQLSEQGKQLRAQLGVDRPVWIAASTHPGEDELILTAHHRIRQKLPNALLLLVPRHLERFDSVAALVQQQGFSLVRRSQQVPCDEETAVYLGDTMGELMLLYAACDVACIAGSFAPIGGHNIIEPAALHKPIVTGPQLFNFAEISELMLQAEGMLKVQTTEELAVAVLQLLEDPSYRQRMSENAFTVVEKNRGALKKQVELIHASF